MSEAVIKFKDFHFAYLNSEVVLHDINMEIRPGSFTVLAGHSGAGKTTLCKAMAGIIPHYYGGRYAGDVEVLGESTQGKKVADLAMDLGLMLEDYESQLVSLTAGEEIAFGLLNHGFNPDEVELRTKKALEDVGLPGRENYQLDELSGGQRQRLLLASLLAVHPKILILDEPVSAMDPQGALSLYKLLNKIYQEYKMTIVVVEHNINFVLPYVTDLVVVEEGRIAAQGAFATAAKQVYEQENLRHMLPALWQIKFNLEDKFHLSLGAWRSEDEGLAEISKKFERVVVER
ncbi:MAG: ABC transporter ATP-binding protein [Acidaminococcaceae bacterium]|jgi:energy-coupling factor transport system ATP-binding protein|nr:ABC transporter ATP-binding protein [Acidaminococcaceae bacterium]